MQISRWTIVVSVAVAVLALLLYRSVRGRMDTLGADPPHNATAQLALDSAAQFHDAVSRGKSDEVCKSADSAAFQTVTGFPCAKFIDYLHEKLGKAIGPKSAEPPVVRATLVTLDVVTEYERGVAQEHFEYFLNGSQATLTNYRIQSDALNH
jgi:hypothetical protein